ncbi:hypothetical protein QQ045_008182 [Rhodiola kirilowii]
MRQTLVFPDCSGPLSTVTRLIRGDEDEMHNLTRLCVGKRSMQAYVFQINWTIEMSSGGGRVSELQIAEYVRFKPVHILWQALSMKRKCRKKRSFEKAAADHVGCEIRSVGLEPDTNKVVLVSDGLVFVELLHKEEGRRSQCCYLAKEAVQAWPWSLVMLLVKCPHWVLQRAGKDDVMASMKDVRMGTTVLPSLVKL